MVWALFPGWKECEDWSLT